MDPISKSILNGNNVGNNGETFFSVINKIFEECHDRLAIVNEGKCEKLFRYNKIYILKNSLTFHNSTIWIELYKNH